MRSGILWACGVWIAVVVSNGSRATAEPPAGLAARSKVLLIGKQPDHPHGTHMYLHTCGVLAKCLAAQGVASSVSDGWPADARVLDDVRGIVVYTTPAAELLLDGPQREQVDSLMKQGVGIATIHWASSIFQQDVERIGPAWLKYMGGTWVSNVGLHTGRSRLKQLLPEHPVCRGWREHEIRDEYYLNPTIQAAQPLLQVVAPSPQNKNPQQEVVVAWVHQRAGGGRAFATTLGHFYENFQQAPFRRMVVNGILWSAHFDVPAAGADVELSAAELALPPKP